jgi:sirohydrochlorin ferrochelatase
MTTALLVIAHGSRHAEANADLFHLVAVLRQREAYAIVAPAFLELAEPDIDSAVSSCIDLGAQRVVLLPYFLSAGLHVRRDLQAIRQRLASGYPHVEFRLAEPLGRHDLLLEIILERAHEACG